MLIIITGTKLCRIVPFDSSIDRQCKSRQTSIHLRAEIFLRAGEWLMGLMSGTFLTVEYLQE
jgi:hypothetical protein